MSKRVKLTGVRDEEENQDLKNLLEKFMRRSEELEIKENTILKQLEIMQSAVASLKEWNESRKASAEVSEPVPADPKEIEEETKLIREETERIQEEIEKKIVQNRLLQEEVARQKMFNSPMYDAVVTEKDDTRVRIPGEEVECRLTSGLDSDTSIELFREKLKKLKHMQKTVREESRLKVDETRKKKKDLSRKMDKLEWELELDWNLLENLQKNRKN